MNSKIYRVTTTMSDYWLSLMSAWLAGTTIKVLKKKYLQNNQNEL